jgi:hypothetical protein
MSQPPKRTSESAADSAAKTTKASDIHRAVSKKEVAKISPKLLYSVVEHSPHLMKAIGLLDGWINEAKALNQENRNSDNPSSDAIQALHDLRHAIEYASADFDQLMDMNPNKWIKLAKLLGVE